MGFIEDALNKERVTNKKYVETSGEKAKSVFIKSINKLAYQTIPEILILEKKLGREATKLEILSEIYKPINTSIKKATSQE